MVVFFVIRVDNSVISQYAIRGKTAEEIKGGMVFTVAPAQMSERITDAYDNDDGYIAIETAVGNTYFYNPVSGLFRADAVVSDSNDDPESNEVTESEFLNMLEEVF